MKRFFNKIKTGLVTFGLALISFPSKVKGLNDWEGKKPQRQPDYGIHYPSEKLYGVPSSVEPTETIIDTVIKIAPRLLIAITFVVGIVSFIKIRKISDKSLKKKRIKKTIIIISLLTILIMGILLLPLFLNK